MKMAKKTLQQLKRLAAKPDSAIDTSDIPVRKNWSRAVIGKFYRPVKSQVTMRIDADVLAWFKSQGGPYQTAVNAALREHVERKSKKGGRPGAKP